MSTNEYVAEERAQLLSIASRSIAHGLEHNSPLHVDPSEYPPHLGHRRACFVTLHSEGRLRGCTGAIIARSPLVVCVAEHAYTSAFRDLRFPPLSRDELTGLSIGISVLSDLEPVTFTDEADLLSQLRPGVDGLIFEVGSSLGTLLPSVWESLPEPVQFLRQLKRKAGFSGDYWSDAVRVSRYTTEQFE